MLPVIEDVADSAGDSELTVESNRQVISDGDACRKGKWFQTPTCRLKFEFWNNLKSNDFKFKRWNLAGSGLKPKLPNGALY